MTGQEYWYLGLIAPSPLTKNNILISPYRNLIECDARPFYHGLKHHLMKCLESTAPLQAWQSLQQVHIPVSRVGIDWRINLHFWKFNLHRMTDLRGRNRGQPSITPNADILPITHPPSSSFFQDLPTLQYATPSIWPFGRIWGLQNKVIQEELRFENSIEKWVFIVKKPPNLFS